MCLSPKTNLNLQYSHGDYNFQNISFTARKRYNSYVETDYITSLLRVSFTDGLRLGFVIYLKVL